MLKKMCAKNRERLYKNLKSKIGDDLENSIILMKGSYYDYENDSDTNYSLARYEANFTYLFGLEKMDVDAGIDLKTNEAFFILKEKDYMEKVIHGKLEKEDSEKLFGISKIYREKEFIEYLKNRNLQRILIHKGIDPGSGHLSNFYDNPEIIDFLKNEKIKIDEDTLYPILNNTRTIKSEEELECMREICKISSLGHIEAMKNCKPGLYEYQIDAIFYQKCSEYNISQYAYWSICGSGKDCSILHYINNDKILKDGDLLLCDMGAKKYSICSDITTTFPVNGKFTEKQKQIYNIVLKSQLESIKALKPGKLFSEISKISFIEILKGLKDLKMLKGDIEEMYKKNIHYYFMPHSLSHYIGFKTHDVGFQKRILNDENMVYKPENYKQYTPVTRDVLYPGIVTTIEPGIYFIDIRFDQAKENEEIRGYFDFDIIEGYKCVGGVRIEDDVFVGNEGVEVMTKCPRTVEEIEKCMRGEDWE